jgi:ABC-type multidrug transport system ATPase subunit
MGAVLRAESIGKRFGQRQVLKTATVWAKPGRITALVGRNGCGKSTLLQTIAGVRAFDSGALHFRGRFYPRPRLHVLARAGLFYVPERGLLSPMMTVRRQLALLKAATDVQRGALAALDLEAFLDRYPRQLSGGERRRADLLIAALRAPHCLLADEPFQGIAPLDIERLSAVLRNLANAGTAVLITGHEVGALFDLADDVVWLTSGSTWHLGPPATARVHEQFRREYLGWQRSTAQSR